ncbi:MAG TPA: PEP-CTERM sorting domain-containing protein [Gammaproteobacteria bacterium]|nr:PEP-CTERM sorting domain-containing protein [Gammaproteobacteria bacterium]HDZ79557.1 PEP-CTERM sorting domain-containing protein [Gammaproteobacteria bacterium]HEC25913.1 PEP-CTERM sorting domain-containing protein [Gammaproteobacteria bacterium]
MVIGDPGQISPVPEPATLALFGIGLAGLGFARKKRKSA